MSGDLTRAFRVLGAVMALFAALYASPASADTPADSSTLSPADDQLRAEMESVLAKPPTGTKDEVCSTLDALNDRVQQGRAKLPARLVTPHSSLQLLRCSRGCCKPCAGHKNCAPTCEQLMERFSVQVHDFEAGTQIPTEDISTTFVDLVKECPRGNPHVLWARSRLLITTSPRELVLRLIALVDKLRLQTDDALELLRIIVKIDSNKVRAAALQELTVTARDLAARGEPVGDDQLRNLFVATSKLLARKLSKGALTDVIRIVREAIKSEEQALRFVGLIALARDLEDSGQSEDLKKALALLLEKYPSLAKDVPPPKTPLAERLRAVVSLLNNAQLAELQQLRDEASFWRLVEGRRLLPLKVAVELDACKQQSAGCAASGALKNEFVKVLKTEWLQSADEVTVDQSVATTIEDAKRIATDPKTCNTFKDDTTKAGSRAGLCTPFLGLVGLRISAPSGDPPKLRAQAFWVMRGLNDNVQTCSPNAGTCPIRESADDEPEAARIGFELAKQTLTNSGVQRLGGKIYAPPQAPSPQAPPLQVPPPQVPPPHATGFARAWQKVGRPVALLAALGLTVGGVYASNTNPNSRTGDWLWRSGLVVWGVEIGAETWLYIGEPSTY